MTEKQKKKFRSGLVAINNGTRYDVQGKLKRLAREIEQGKHGDVRDAVVIVRKMRAGAHCTTTYHYGAGTFGDVILMLEGAKGDVS